MFRPRTVSCTVVSTHRADITGSIPSSRFQSRNMKNLMAINSFTGAEIKILKLFLFQKMFGCIMTLLLPSVEEALEQYEAK